MKFLNWNIIPDIFISAFFHRLLTEYRVTIHALWDLFHLDLAAGEIGGLTIE